MRVRDLFYYHPPGMHTLQLFGIVDVEGADLIVSGTGTGVKSDLAILKTSVVCGVSMR